MVRTGRNTIFVDLALLTLMAAVLYLPGLGTRDLWNPNEPIYGRAVIEMDERSDWLIPTVNGKDFAEKPILYYWMALASSWAAGDVTEFSLRTPSVLSTSAALFLTYFIVLPYAGRRRALAASILLGSTYSVFWCARWIQMDSLMLVTTTATLLPLSRMADHGLPPWRGWFWVGLACGFGFLGKGPVAIILPALVFFTYALVTRRPSLLRPSRVWIAIPPFALLVLPWLLSLHWAGHGDFLHEMLFRQNFSRFVDAWDHRHPWYYYLKYLWIDYAPWSWFAPLALFTTGLNHDKRRLHILACCWIAGIVIFFSLSDSKRSPYILPIAPAMAILASAYLHRLVRGTLTRRLRIAGLSLFGFWSLLLAATAVFLLNSTVADLAGHPFRTWGLAALLLSGATGISVGIILHPARRAMAGSALMTVTLAVYIVAAIWLLPAGNQWKSARPFCAKLKAEMRNGGQISSYLLWDWRAEYAFYLGRTVENLSHPKALLHYWQGDGHRQLIVEGEEARKVERMLGTFPSVHQIGGRRVYLFEKQAATGGGWQAPSLASAQAVDRPGYSTLSQQ